MTLETKKNNNLSSHKYFFFTVKISFPLIDKIVIFGKRFKSETVIFTYQLQAVKTDKKLIILIDVIPF